MQIVKALKSAPKGPDDPPGQIIAVECLEFYDTKPHENADWMPGKSPEAENIHLQLHRHLVLCKCAKCA